LGFLSIGMLVASTPCAARPGAPDINADGFADLPIGVFKEDIDGVANAGALHLILGSGDGLTSNDNQFLHQNATADGVALLDTAEIDDGFGSVVAWGDFNDDGFADLAVGIPNEDIGANSNAGAVAVLYGSDGGLSGEGNQFFHQNIEGVLDDAEQGDAFGGALAVGDFNGDGFADLAIGVRNEDLPGAANAGAVNILLGSADGLTAVNSQFFHQDSFDMQGVAGANDGFGGALASGDFDDDGFDDLAIGVRNEDLGTPPVPVKRDVGAVQVLYGSAAGLTTSFDQFWTQDTIGILDVAEAGDQFGAALAVGDLDDDGFDDLAIGVPNQLVGGKAKAGAVVVLYGNALGLSDLGDQVWNQDSPGITNTAAANEFFGTALASGDFDGDGADDLAVGVPSQAVGGVAGGGAMHIIFGSPAGLVSAGNQYVTQNTAGVLDTAEVDDGLGKDFIAGDFDGDSFVDLAFGVKNESSGVVTAVGAVGVLYGSAGGLDPAANQLWTQDSPGILDEIESGDRFGDL
jgi:hypothetical protein